MKKFYYSLFAAVSMMLAVTSCSQEEDFGQESSGDLTKFSVSLKGAVQSRAVGTGETVDYLYFAVYQDGERVYPNSKNGKVEITNFTAVVPVPLLKGEEYDIIFWAQKDGNEIYNVSETSDLTEITVDYTKTLSNQESYDAFYNALEGFRADNKVHTIELRRPFAQLNLGTSDWEKAKDGLPMLPDANGNLQKQDPVTHSKVVIKGLANTFNPLTGVAEGGEENEVVFDMALLRKDESEKNETFKLTIGNEEKTYTNLALNYLLVPCTKGPQGTGRHEAISSNDKALVDVTFTLYRGTEKLFTMDKIASVPVQRNYRTNIIGELLTGTGFDVVIKPEEDKPSTNLVAIVEGLVQDEATGVYYISSANGLSYASQNLFAQNGGSYVLTADIDMTGATSVSGRAADALTYTSAKLTHTMTAERSFEFDGNGHSIKSLPGMFIAYTGSAKSVVVKNLTLDTPNVAFDVEDVPETNGVGAFIGYAGTTTTITLDNCHVKGGKIEGGHWTGGLVGYAAGYSGNDGPVFETLTIKDCSVKNATVTGKGSIGGIIGHATGDAWTLVDMDNINVTSNTIISTGSSDNKAGSVMGTLGIAGAPKTVNGVTKVGGTTIDSYEVSGNRVESNKVANTKLWGRQAGGVLTLDGTKVEDFGSYTEPASEFTYENGVYTLQKITASALTDILADANTNSYGAITIELAEDQSLSWAAGPAGDGANKLAHNGKVTIKNGTLSVTGAGSFVVENELELDGVTVVDNTAYYAENGETAWEFCYLELKAKGTYKNCIFENTIKVDGQEATFENCKFLGKSTNEANADGEYAVWVYNGEAKFVECEFTGARGMKICDYYSGADVTAVEIDNCKFNGLSKKPGLAIDERQGTKMVVTIKNSTFTDVQPGDQGLYIYETDNVVPTIKNSKVIINGVEVLAFDENGYKVVNVSNDAELDAAIANATGDVAISLAAGTYSNDINLTVAKYGGAKGDLVFKAAENSEPVIAGTVTLGLYEKQSTNVAKWKGNVTFEGITFDHAEAEKHSFSIQNVGYDDNATALTLRNCKIIGDGEYGIGSNSGCAAYNSLITGCTFENGAMQITGNFGTGLVIEKCTFKESRINVQSGNGVTVQNCNFTNTLTDANVSDSFYVIRGSSNGGGIPVTVKQCKIDIKSTLEGVEAKDNWGILWNRGTQTSWTVENVAVTMTEAAMNQTSLLVTKTAGGAINTTNLTVNGKGYASTAAQLTSAVVTATEIYVQGEFKMPTNGTSKAITISSLNGNATIDNTLGSYWENATLTFNNVKFKTSTGKANGNGSDYAALYSKNVTYNECSFSGPMRLGRDGAKFIKCTFNDLGNDYVWTYGNAATFKDCTFNSAGKALLIYSDGGNGAPAVSVTGCKFFATTGAKAGAIANQNCAAIEIHNYGYGVTLTTSDNIVEKGDKFSGEWRIKTYENRNANSKIFVNGTEYTTLALDGKTMTIDGSNVTVQ